MRIIRVGQKPEDKTYRGTCHNCKSIFECQQHEGRVCYAHQRDGGGMYVEVKCPVCGEKAQAYERKDDQPIPANMRDWYGDLLPTPRNDSYYWIGDFPPNFGPG